ncbi:MAG: S8 family serine peptidase [Thermoplasmata archaeon]|nr:S8 family serine peptidase [Thermoplasmata archaeon]
MMIGRKALSILVIAMMLLSTLLVVSPNSADGWESEGVPIEQNDGITQDIDLNDMADKDIAKSDDATGPLEESDIKRSKGLTKVYVATDNVKELADFLKDYQYKGTIGNQRSQSDQISFLLLELPIEIIEDVGELEGVIDIYGYTIPEYSPQDMDIMQELFNNDPKFLDTLSMGNPTPSSIGGYTGLGVNIAVVDSGVDFAHPDLLDAYARDEMISDVRGEILISEATSGQTVANFQMDIVTIVNESVATNAAGGETDLPVKYKNVVDGTVSIYINKNISTDFTFDLATGFVTLGTALTAGDNLTVTYDYYFVQRNVKTDTIIAYGGNGDTISGFTHDTAKGIITFDTALVAGAVVTVDYSYYSPYYGWPIAFDPVSMEEFLLDQGDVDDTFYVNSSISGTGPFESAHTISMDGMSDFSASEGFIYSIASTENMDMNVDLKDLSVTRDRDNWYFGYSTKMGLTDKSYSIYIDIDGSASGGSFDPLGNYIDTNASHNTFMNVVAYSPDGTLIASAAGNIIKIWDSATGLVKATIESTTVTSVASMIWSADGNWLCSANDDTITIRDVSNLNDITVVNEIFYPAGTSQAYGGEKILAHKKNATGDWIAIGGVTGDETQIYVYNALTANDVNDRYGKYNVGGNIETISFSPDGEYLAATVRTNKEARILQVLGPGSGNHTDIAIFTATEDIKTLAWSPDSSKIITGSIAGNVSIWDVTGGVWEHSFTTQTGIINSVDWDGSRIISAAEDKTVNIWDSGTYASISSQPHFREILSVNFSAAGGYTTGSADAKVETWGATGTWTNTFIANLPDYVLVTNYTREQSDDWSIDEDGIVMSNNDTMKNTTLYTWNGVGWDSLDIMNETIGGAQAYRSFLDGTNQKIDKGFVEITLPRDLISGNPDIIYSEVFVTAQIGKVVDELLAVDTSGTNAKATLANNNIYPYLEYAEVATYELKSGGLDLKDGEDYWIDVGTGAITFNGTPNNPADTWASYYYFKEFSRAQDSVPDDINIADPNTDWSDTITSLSNFGRTEINYFIVDLEVANASRSNIYKFGFHSGDAQINKYGALGILVVDDQVKGQYEKVYVDLNEDNVFNESDRVVSKGDETTWLDIDNDGLPDRSAGTLYYIADGMTPLPYSEIISERRGILDRNSLDNYTDWRNTFVPKAGEVVCLVGEFSYDDYDGIVLSHGTQSAVVIAGRGNPAVAKSITGMAPEAKIIPIMNIDQAGNIFDAWYFAVEGYDGIPGTGDEAVIVNNGFNYPGIYEDGWDPYSHYADYISIEYSEGHSLFVVSAGDDGYGYGTVASPGACPGVLTIGSVTDYTYRSDLGNEGAGNGKSNDISYYSARGPSSLGVPKPDILAPGTGYTGKPLSNNGLNAYFDEVWVSTEYACAATVGMLGPIYEAYWNSTHSAMDEMVITAIENITEVQLKRTPIIDESLTLWIDGAEVTPTAIDLNTGIVTVDVTEGQAVTASYDFYNVYPDAMTARSLVMSGADDTNNDVFTQGAGLINAERSVLLAHNSEGLLVNPASWVPGNFSGNDYDSFVKLINPGSSDSQDFVIENMAIADQINIYDAGFTKIGEYKEMFSILVNKSTKPDDFTVKVDILDKIPFNTEMLKVTAHAPLSQLDLKVDGVIEEDSDFTYNMALLDWTDVNGDGLFPLLQDKSEGNTFDECLLFSNVLQVRIDDPISRATDGLIVKVFPKTDMPTINVENPIDWTITCEFYAKSDWDWLTLTNTPTSLAADTEGTFKATIDVPADAEIGSYEGAIYIDHDVQSIVGELKADYPKFSNDEMLENISVDTSVVGEILPTTTASLAHLNPYVNGTPTIWKTDPATPPIAVVNESVWVDATTGDTFNMGYTNILDYNIWVDDGTWWDLVPWLDPITPVDLATGDVFIDGWNLWDGCTVYAWLNLTPASPPVELTSPADYTLYPGNGTIVLNTPLLADEYLTANYSYFSLAEFDGVQLANVNILDIDIYANYTDLLAEGVDYTIDRETGYVTFTPAILVRALDVSYDWHIPQYVPYVILDNKNLVPGTFAIQNNGVPMVTGYTLYEKIGIVEFDTPLLPGDLITVDYDHYAHTMTIPVMVNVPVNKADFTLTGETTNDVIDEIVTDVPTTQITNEEIVNVPAIDIVGETVVAIPFTAISEETVMSNMPIDIANEFILYSLGGDDNPVKLEHSEDPGEDIVNLIVYADGTPLVDGVDYTHASGVITFIGAYEPIPAGVTFTADYTIHLIKEHGLLLDHGSDTSGERIEPGTYTVWLDGSLLTDTVHYDMNLKPGQILMKSPFNLPVGSVVTASYSYYPEINDAELDFGPLANEEIIPGSYVVMNNGVPLTEGTDYAFDESTGDITFLGIDIYRPLPYNATITVDYSYFIEIYGVDLEFGTMDDEYIIANSYELILDDGTPSVMIEGIDYVIVKEHANVIFLTIPGPGDIITASYSYYDPETYTATYATNYDLKYDFKILQLDCNPIVEGTLELYKNTTLMDQANYTVDLQTGFITFMDTLHPSDIISASYVYSDTNLILFNNKGMIGGSGAEGQSGDWRFFYMNIPDQGLNKNEDGLLNLYIDADWNTKPSDIDIFVFGKVAQTNIPETTDAISANRYGSYTLENIGGSEESTSFYTSTNESKEIVITPLSGGLNVIALHNVGLHGIAAFEDVALEVGWLSLSSATMDVWSNDLAGEASISLVSNREFTDGMSVSAVGPASGEITREMVYQDNLDIIDELSFYHGLTLGTQFHKAIKVESALTLDIHIWPEDENMVPDLDLGICYDVNEDGIGQFEELVTNELCDFVSASAYGYTDYYASCADWDADEGVKLINPPDGQYIVTVLGYTVKSEPQPFFLEVKAIRAGVEGYGISGDVGEDMAPAAGTYETVEKTDTYQTHTYSLNWNFPGSSSDGEYGGVINVGPSTAPGIMTILANVVLDREAPTIIDPMPADQSTIRDNLPIIIASIEDTERAEIDGDGFTMLIDGIDVTPLAKKSVDYDDEYGGGGYPRGTISYTPSLPLSEGAHRVDLTTSDWAGNTNTVTWVFTVKTTTPGIEMSQPAEDVTYTNEATFTLKGITDPGCIVEVFGATVGTVTLDLDGSFSATITLSPGENMVEVVSTDVIGNSQKTKLEMNLDTTAPRISSIRSTEGFLTNTDTTTFVGQVSEPGNLYVNSIPVKVNADGTFTSIAQLNEGENAIAVIFEDMAGNAVTKWMNVSKDSVKPTIDISIPEAVSDGIINISGKVIDGYSVKINGKIPTTDSTRDGDIDFTKAIALSWGKNIIVIEAMDEAGNVIEFRHVIELTQDTGTNYAAIGIMIILLIVGLLVGLFIAMAIWKETPEEEEIEPVDGEDIEPVEGEEIISDEDLEADDEMPEGEDIDEEPMMVEGEEFETEDELLVEDEETEVLDEEMSIDEEPMDLEDGSMDIDEEPIEDMDMADIPEDAEPIPMEEGLPEDIEEDAIVEMDDTLEDADIEESEGEIEAEAEAPEEDERVTRLKKAFEDGKISEELYNKNLAKLQE